MNPKQHTTRTPIPEPVRNAVLARAQGRCEDCGRKAPLEMHHTTYRMDELSGVICVRPDKGYCVVERDGKRIVIEDIFGNEDETVLRALCRDCHHGNHIDPAGDFWADTAELENYWATYWSEMDKD